MYAYIDNREVLIIMSRTDLVQFIAEETGLTKADATRAVDAFWKGVTKGLKEEGKVAFVGLGTFAAKKKEARTSRNPRTGEPVNVPARTAITFKAGSKLKDALN